MTARDRHSLYSRLAEVLGSNEADYLMTHLPRDPSDQVATKGDIERLESATRGDIERLESATRGEFQRLEARFDRLEERFDRLTELVIDQQKYYARATVGSMVGLTAIFSLVVTYFG